MHQLVSLYPTPRCRLLDPMRQLLATPSVARDGSFLLRVAPGTYEVTAIKDGFLPAVISSRVSEMVVNRLDLALKTGKPTVETEAPAPNTSVLNELQSLRKRIEQLESELNAPKPIAAPSAVLPAATPAPDQPPVEAKSALPVIPAPADLNTPFADYDWTWLNGSPRTTDSPLDSKYFTGEFRTDTHYGMDFNQPIDHSMGGSSEVFRSSEVQLEQVSLGGDLHVGNVRGRLLTLFGMFAQTTPRNDASVAVGQWDCSYILPLLS